MQFKDIIGQDKIKKSLIQSVKQNRVPHALLISGKDGNGNLPLAIAFAAYTNCKNRTEEDSCGTCPSCTKYGKFAHPDLHLVFPTFKRGKNAATTNEFLPEFRELLSENIYADTEDWKDKIGSENKALDINVSQCREMIKTMAYKSFEAEFKVMILWLPEYLGQFGNVILKLIEEPAPGTIFILCTSQIDKILTTILSRTQITHLQIPTMELISDMLIKQKEMKEGVANNIALLADGSINKALKLIHELEHSQFAPMREWMQYCFKGNAADINKQIADLSSRGREDLKAFLHYGLHILRACILHPYGVNNNKLTPEENTFISKLAQFFQRQKGEKAYEVFNNAIYWVERNGNVKIVLFDLSLELQKIFKSR